MRQRTARGWQVIVRDQGADQDDRVIAPEQRQGRCIAVAFDARMLERRYAMRDDRAVGGSIAVKISADEIDVLAEPLHRATRALGAIVLETGHEYAQIVPRQNGTTVGVAVAVAQRHVDQVQAVRE